MLDWIIDPMISWVMGIISWGGYWGIAISMIIESFFVPFPSEIIMPFSGFLASSGQFTVWGIALVGGIGSYIGTLPFYFLGLVGGDSVVRKFLKKWGKWLMVTEEDLDKSNDLFNRKGNFLILFGRLIPGIRSVISIPAGISKMRFLTYSAYTLAGSIFWSFILGYFGFVLGENWEIVGGYLQKFKYLIIIVLVIIGVWFIWSKLKKKKK